MKRYCRAIDCNPQLAYSAVEMWEKKTITKARKGENAKKRKHCALFRVFYRSCFRILNYSNMLASRTTTRSAAMPSVTPSASRTYVPGLAAVSFQVTCE